MIYILSSQEAAVFGISEKSTWAAVLQMPPSKADLQPKRDDQVYLDISGLTPAGLKSALAALKKICAGSFWGIIDPKGAVEDPALFFFEGGSDYIGPALVKKGLDKKRFAVAQKAALAAAQASLDSRASKKELEQGQGGSSKAKLPGGAFEGWKSLRSGTNAPFLFLFISASENSKLPPSTKDSVFRTAKERLRDVLQQALSEANGLLWIETENNCLFLVPPRAPNAQAAVEAGLKLILNSRLIGIEKIMPPLNLNFTVALHYGQTVYHAPGKTGEIVSETVNYIFHLGAKKAEAGRLTISADVPEEAIPKELLDLFSPAGVFQGIPIRRSKRFV